MERSTFAGLVALLGVMALCGCAPTAATAPATPAPAPAPAQRPITMGAVPAAHVAPGEKIDNNIVRNDAAEVIFQLDIYQLSVPFGAISSNARFWKHVDEDHVDLATHALLLKNGLRFGIGPNSEWSYFKSLIDQYGASARKGTIAPTRKGSIELPMASNIREQNIFFFREPHDLYGRTYEKCDNLLSVTFEPTPRRPGDARIEACALVRGLRRQYEVTILNDTREIEYKKPEYLYDLRLCEDVPLDHFLIVAPSAMAELPSSLGNAFLVQPGLTEPMETVLLLVPRPFRMSK
jgi:hypothetical protein